MENKEFSYKGAVLSGFVALLFVIILFALAITFFIKADKDSTYAIFGVICLFFFAICMNDAIKALLGFILIRRGAWVKNIVAD